MGVKDKWLLESVDGCRDAVDCFSGTPWPTSGLEAGKQEQGDTDLCML